MEYPNDEALSMTLKKWYHEDKYLGMEAELEEFIVAQLAHQIVRVVKS